MGTVDQARHAFPVVAIEPQVHSGRDTPASAATSFLGRPSPRHNTIRALVATVADTSRLFTKAHSSTL